MKNAGRRACVSFFSGGDAESRTPVQRWPHKSVYSLDDIGFYAPLNIDE